jgi:hypothetical protein
MSLSWQSVSPVPLYLLPTSLQLPLPPAAPFLDCQKRGKEQPKAAAFGNCGAHVSEVVCLWSTLRVVFYSLGLSPPGFAENVLMLWLLCPDRSGVLW